MLTRAQFLKSIGAVALGVASLTATGCDSQSGTGSSSSTSSSKTSSGSSSTSAITDSQVNQRFESNLISRVQKMASSGLSKEKLKNCDPYQTRCTVASKTGSGSSSVWTGTFSIYDKYGNFLDRANYKWHYDNSNLSSALTYKAYGFEV